MTFIFKHGAQTAERILKQFQYPEFAFVGRSNVGKSSLINAITQQKDLAHTSKTPGRTQQINYFLDEKKKFYLVDLPGYGFSKTDNKTRKEWDSLMDAYFTDNPKLKKVFILIDVRRGIMDSDQTMIEYVRTHQHNYSLVFTKCDKRGYAQDLPKGIIMTSVLKKTGLDELQKTMALLI